MLQFTRHVGLHQLYNVGLYHDFTVKQLNCYAAKLKFHVINYLEQFDQCL